MQKIRDFLDKNLRTLIIVLIFIVALVFAAIIFTLVVGENGDRMLMVTDVSGSAFVVKSDGRIPAIRNMTVSSGDVIVTEKDSGVRLKTDKGKYIYVESSSTVYVYFTEKAEKGSIVVNISDGSVLCRLDNKLKGGSTFEVRTPNSITSLKGTVLHAGFTYYDSYSGFSNVMRTEIHSIESPLMLQLYDSEGSKSGTDVELTEGTAAELITSSGFTGYTNVNQPYSLSDLSAETLKNLIAISGEHSLPCSLSDLNTAYLTASSRTEPSETSAVYVTEGTSPEWSNIITETEAPASTAVTSETEPADRTVVTDELTEETASGSEETVFTVPPAESEAVTSQTTTKSVTTTAPPQTTKAPAKTTAAPQTTKAPAKTTAAPQTTRKPAVTTAPPQTTAAPITTAPPQTTRKPRPTTAPTQTAAETTAEATTPQTTQPPETETAQTTTTIPWWEIINDKNKTAE